MYNSQYLHNYCLQYLQWVVCYEIYIISGRVPCNYNFYKLCPSLGFTVHFRKSIPTFHARVATLYIEAWFLLDLIMIVKRFKNCPVGR